MGYTQRQAADFLFYGEGKERSNPDVMVMSFSVYGRGCQPFRFYKKIFVNDA